MDWSEIDKLLFQGKYLPAFMEYMKLRQSSLPEALHTVGNRADCLREQFPERFAAPVPSRKESSENLAKMKASIFATEAFWDGDTDHN